MKHQQNLLYHPCARRCVRYERKMKTTWSLILGSSWNNAGGRWINKYFPYNMVSDTIKDYAECWRNKDEKQTLQFGFLGKQNLRWEINVQELYSGMLLRWTFEEKKGIKGKGSGMGREASQPAVWSQRNSWARGDFWRCWGLSAISIHSSLGRKSVMLEGRCIMVIHHCPPFAHFDPFLHVKPGNSAWAMIFMFLLMHWSLYPQLKILLVSMATWC